MVYVFLTDGFEEIEAITPIDIMRRAGVAVKTVSITDSRYVTGSHDITVKADISIKDAVYEDIDMIILPGGPGHTSLDENDTVHEFIDRAAGEDKFIAAICAAPSIVGKKGLLKGRRATAFPGYEKYLEGAEILADKAVSDGRFITAKGAGAAAEFGFMIVSELLGEEKAKEIRESMQY